MPRLRLAALAAVTCTFAAAACTAKTDDTRASADSANAAATAASVTPAPATDTSPVLAAATPTADTASRAAAAAVGAPAGARAPTVAAAPASSSSPSASATVAAARVSRPPAPAAGTRGVERPATVAAASRATAVATTGTPAASTAATSATAAASAADGGDVKVNRFMSYDASAKRVKLDVIAAFNNVQGGFNFNGGSNGGQTITVPTGWTVAMHVKNVDAIPHSAIVIADQKPLPNAPDNAAIPRAYSAHVSDGLQPQNGADDVNFKTSKPGTYLIYCGVPGHGPSGMYIKFVVSESATAPSYSM